MAIAETPSRKGGAYSGVRGNLWQRYIQPGLLYAVLLILSIIFLIPFYVIIRNGLMTQAQITAPDWIWLPSELHLENLDKLFNDPIAPMATGLRNSLLIAVTQVIGQMLFASMAGYGLARIPYRWRNLVFYAMLVTLMIPGAVTFIPKYVVVYYLGMVNTVQGIIVPDLFNVFAAFLFRQFYLNFPKELEEAGRVDGLTYWGIYWRILLPNSRAILASLGALTFISSWNSFLWPLVIGHDSSTWTVQIVLSTFLTAQTINLPALFMGAVVGILPLVIVFLLLQRYIVQGVARSGITG
ncbi:MAG TPA: carbohydrate ABC transporter permease [Chloroflexia bacterium]|nr:carbohydrate ABC transporter permease [Chloroflexia bacterium]